jgi:excisionase family DNA binding protein
MLANEEAASVSVSGQDRSDIFDLYARMQAAEAKLAAADGNMYALPPNLSSFLSRVLGELTAGNPITILESNAELTTMEAARMLSVSRQFLVQLLEQGQIPFHKVGTHRRVYSRDVLTYKTKRDSERRKVWDDLVRKEIEDGTYFAVPLNALIDE